jgi:hypothetical protein
MYIKDGMANVNRIRRGGGPDPTSVLSTLGFGGMGDVATTDAHGCTSDKVWNDTAGACVSLEQNLAIINQGVAAANTASPPAATSNLLMYAAIGGLAYFLFFKK